MFSFLEKVLLKLGIRLNFIQIFAIVFIFLLLAISIKEYFNNTNYMFRIFVILSISFFFFAFLFHIIFKVSNLYRFEWIRPAFRPPPGAATIPPEIKSVLRIKVPKKVKKGNTAEIKLEIFEYTWLPYLDVSETIIKNIYTRRTPSDFQLRLESPSFEVSPNDEIIIKENSKFPVKCKWLIEAKTLGEKKFMLHIDENLIDFLGKQDEINNPIIFPIVVSELGLNAKTVLKIKAIAVVLGFIFSIPVLSPLFKLLGEKLIEIFK